MVSPPPARPPQLPAWLGWVQLSLTTMLLVLFLVVLGRSHGQVQQLRRLQGRLANLEAQRSAERAANQDTQLLSQNRRLEQLESRLEQAEAGAQAEREALRQALARLQQRGPQPSDPGADTAVDDPPPPRRQAGGGGLPSQPLRPPPPQGDAGGER